MDSDISIITRAHDLIDNGNLSGAFSLINENFQENDPRVSSLRGYLINNNAGSEAVSHFQAAKFFKIGADNGISYDQRELGILLLEIGQSTEALDWLIKASKQGDSEASLKIYWVLSSQQKLESLEYLKIAHTQGNARATQKYAIERIKGRLGFKSIFGGFKMYIENIPKLIAYVKHRSRLPH